MTRDWRTWLLIGAVGFGGPAGQAAILHRELVERRRWLDEDEFLAALRVCMLLPGPEAQQLATYAGWRRSGLAGGVLAGTLFVLPGAVLVTALAWLHAAGGAWPLVAAAFAGTRPAVVAIVALAAWRIGRKSLGAQIGNLAAVSIHVASLAALASGIPFPAAVLAAGLLGCLLLPASGLSARAEQPAGEKPSAIAGLRPAIGHVAAVVAIAAVIWAACLWGVTATHAAGDRGGTIARLFTTTTLLSLGGAYAVVPWALDESLARGWLEPGDRFAALAMGEATPGPLILVVTFIGFLAGWRADPCTMLAGGLTGAVTATAFAFIPSFAMVLAVAPAVSSIRPASGLGRALAGVSAAVVAAIAVLAITLAEDALLAAGGIDPVSVTVALLSAVALAWGKVPTPLVVLGAAAIGVLRWTA